MIFLRKFFAMVTCHKYGQKKIYTFALLCAIFNMTTCDRFLLIRYKKRKTIQTPFAIWIGIVKKLELGARYEGHSCDRG